MSIRKYETFNQELFFNISVLKIVADKKSVAMINMRLGAGAFKKSLQKIKVEGNIWMNVYQHTITAFSIKIILSLLLKY